MTKQEASLRFIQIIFNGFILLVAAWLVATTHGVLRGCCIIITIAQCLLLAFDAWELYDRFKVPRKETRK